MKKELLSLAVVSALSLGFTGCGGEEEASDGGLLNTTGGSTVSTSSIYMKEANITVASEVNFYDNSGISENYVLQADDDQYLVVSPSTTGSKIQLSFDSFDISSSDYIYIYDGKGEDRKIIGYYNSNWDYEIDDPNDATKTITKTKMPTFTSTIRFNQNTSYAYDPGWEATLKEVNTTSTVLMRESIVNVNEDIRFLDNGGELANYVSSLTATDDRNITFFPADTTKRVKIDFDRFDISTSDFMYIYSGTGSEKVLFGYYNGDWDYEIDDPNDVTKTITKTKMITYESINPGEPLTIRFDKNTGIDVGWDATVSQISSDIENMNMFTNGSYTLESNQTVKLYDNGGADANHLNIDATMTIYPSDSSKKVSINFADLDLSIAGYPDTYLKIYNGSDTTAPKFANYTGDWTTTMPTITSTAPDGSLTLFLDDGDNTDSGFEATISEQ